MSKGLLAEKIILPKEWWQDDAAPVRRKLGLERAPKREKERQKPGRATVADIPDLLTYQEAAEKIRCSITTIYAMIADGEIEGLSVRGKRFIAADSIVRYFEEQRKLR